VELPTGYAVRPPNERDAEAVADVVVAEDVADFGEPSFTQEDLLDDWKRPRFLLHRDAWVLSGPTGRVIGYAYVWEEQPDTELEADAFLMPEYTGRGLGGLLLDLVEERAREICGGRSMRLGLYAATVNDAKRTLLQRRGFESVRSVLRLRIDLEQRTLEPVEPPLDIELRVFDPADADAVRSVMQESFEGHHRYTLRRFDEWLDLRLRHPAFDPSLWRVAVVDGEVVGAALVYDVGVTGYLSSVGVRRAWRGHGVAPALLREAFATLRERGQMRVVVSIDADAAPATARLYEEAGMRVHEQYDWFTKTVGTPA
jgi:GNAT superfamily N-acetyltransferase